MKKNWLTVLGVAFALAGCAMGSPFYTAEPFSAQVVDKETGQPIAGANVVANWELVSGGSDGERHLGQLEVKETVTDEMGRFHFEGFTRLNPSLAELRYADPRVIVFKGGYDVQTYYSAIVDPRDLPGPRRKATVDGAVLKLEKIKPDLTGKTIQGMMLHSSLHISVAQIVRDCEWKKIPRLLVAMDDENRRLEAQYPTASVRIGFEDFKMESKRDCSLDANFVRGQR